MGKPITFPAFISIIALVLFLLVHNKVQEQNKNKGNNTVMLWDGKGTWNVKSKGKPGDALYSQSVPYRTILNVPKTINILFCSFYFHLPSTSCRRVWNVTHVRETLVPILSPLIPHVRQSHFCNVWGKIDWMAYRWLTNLSDRQVLMVPTCSSPSLFHRFDILVVHLIWLGLWMGQL